MCTISKIYVWVEIVFLNDRKLSLPVPNRKIRINTRLDGDIFDPSSSFIETGKEHLKGWSFVNSND